MSLHCESTLPPLLAAVGFILLEHPTGDPSCVNGPSSKLSSRVKSHLKTNKRSLQTSLPSSLRLLPWVLSSTRLLKPPFSPPSSARPTRRPSRPTPRASSGSLGKPPALVLYVSSSPVPLHSHSGEWQTPVKCLEHVINSFSGSRYHFCWQPRSIIRRRRPDQRHRYPVLQGRFVLGRPHLPCYLCSYREFKFLAVLNALPCLLTCRGSTSPRSSRSAGRWRQSVSPSSPRSSRPSVSPPSSSGGAPAPTPLSNCFE